MRLNPEERIGSDSVKISMICFTENGHRIQERLAAGLREKGYQVVLFGMDRHTQKAGGGIYADHDADRDAGSLLKPVLKGTLSSWTGEQFQEADGIVFIGACGIAVRSIAPFIRDKRTDPAVVSIDETGRFAVPLLSGHLGGANALAKTAAEILGACPVITTATDLNRKFAVDLFAAENGLMIDDMKAAKEISADILAGEPVGFFSEFPIVAENEKETDWIPKGCRREKAEKNIRITVKEREPDWAEEDLILRPRALCLGVGCRRGIETKRLKDTVFQALAKANLSPAAVKTLATIDLKSDEKAIRQLAEERGWELRLFSAEELNAVQGSFSGSDFVQKTVGVDNVCERAALAALPGGRLVMEKKAENGVTAAAAVGKVRIAAGGPRQVPGIIAHKGPKDGP